MQGTVKEMEFLQYMKERHLMYLRRVYGAPEPWSTDPVLRQVYLTNVYRELDKVTIWVREHIREPYADHPNLWLMLAIARCINVPGTLQALIDRGVLPLDYWDADQFVDVLEERMADGMPTFTNAYMTWGGSEKGRQKSDLFAEMFGLMWEKRYDIRPLLWGTLEDSWKVLQAQLGLGGFLAYEVVTDLRHTEYLRDAPDIMTWAFAGPGAKRGLNWIHGNDPHAPIRPADATAEMKRLLDMIAPVWARTPGLQPSPPLEMREIEHSLCEFSKVCALRYLGQRPKRWYRKEPV